ncbi:unnamed protein product, partial [Polarella glacialis]
GMLCSEALLDLSAPKAGMGFRSLASSSKTPARITASRARRHEARPQRQAWASGASSSLAKIEAGSMGFAATPFHRQGLAQEPAGL